MKGFKHHSERKVEGSEGNGGWHEGNKHDDKARSYKGVLLNGNGARQNRERDTREYYGKGKGKMVEDTDSKWVRVADRSNRKNVGAKGNNRGRVEEERYKSSRREDTKQIEQERNKTVSPRHMNAQQQLHEEAQEEGEIRNEVEVNGLPPSEGFKEALARTQAVGQEVVSDPIDTEKGLKQLHGLVEGQLKIGEDEVMDWDDLEAVDDLPEPTAEELAATTLELEEHAGSEDTEAQTVTEEATEQKFEEEAMQNVTKKRLFKSTLSTAASSKMRNAKALASPRKRAPVRAGSRQGENRHQQESKIASNLLAVHQKP
ncbi:Uncharacterized protein Rs2_35673 [Raphanus sativus]|nr:Uncharacterized protein Rs2_35673 [Raphanus sativus]